MKQYLRTWPTNVTSQVTHPSEILKIIFNNHNFVNKIVAVVGNSRKTLIVVSEKKILYLSAFITENLLRVPERLKKRKYQRAGLYIPTH